MISISINKVEGIIRNSKGLINNFITQEINIIKIKEKITSLINRRTSRNGEYITEEKIYLNKLNEKLEEIIYAHPEKLEEYKIEFDEFSFNQKNEKEWKSFKDSVITALGYTTLRTNLYPIYFSKIGIKSCVYCNSQLAITTKPNKKEYGLAKFQVDHYLAKSYYPCFSISFYNLYPTCAPCNLVKGNKEILFKLYSKDNTEDIKSEFNFTLEPGCKTKYLLSGNINDIKIIFHEPQISQQTNSKSNIFSIKEILDIEGIYNTQKDIVEELIHKAKIYNDSYKSSLIKQFPSLYSNSLYGRLLIGTYSDSKDIHKRPLAKFIQDIARDLELIPNENQHTSHKI